VKKNKLPLPGISPIETQNFGPLKSNLVLRIAYSNGNKKLIQASFSVSQGEFLRSDNLNPYSIRVQFESWLGCHLS
jgi:hypothetical protein